MHPGIVSASRGSLSYSYLISLIQSLTHLSVESNLANISPITIVSNCRRAPPSSAIRIDAVGTRKIKNQAKPSDARGSSANEMRKARREIRYGKVRKATKVAFPVGTLLGR